MSSLQQRRRVVDFSRFAEEVRALYTPPLRRKATCYKVWQALEEFGAIPSVQRTSDITPALIARWIAAHGDRKPITNQGVLRAFRSACSYAKSMGYLAVSPWDIRKDWINFEGDEDEQARTPKHRSIADIARILDLLKREAAAGGWKEWRLYALVGVFAYTGMRKMEALGLTISDVSMEHRLIVIRSRKQRRLKTRGSAGVVGIPDELAAILEPWLLRLESREGRGPAILKPRLVRRNPGDGKGWSWSDPAEPGEWLFPNVRKWSKPWTGGMQGSRPLCQVKAAAERAGVEGGITLHGFRHSLATAAGRFSMSPLELKALLRHTSLGTQSHYIGTDADNARDIARRITYQVPPARADPGDVASVSLV